MSLTSHSINAFNLNDQIKSQPNTDVYHVIIASFKDEVNALNKVKDLQSIGFIDSKIVKIANTILFRISIKSFANKSDANIFLRKNRSTFKDAWILIDSTQEQTTFHTKKSFNSGPTKIKLRPQSKDLNKDQSNTPMSKFFRVIIGSYKKEIFAYYQKWDLEKKGFNNTKVIQDKDKSSYLVSIESFKNKDGAINLKDSLKNSEYKNSWILMFDDDNKQNKLNINSGTQNKNLQIVSNESKNINKTTSIINDSLGKSELTGINSKNSASKEDQKNTVNEIKNLNNLSSNQEFEENTQNQSQKSYTATNSLNKIEEFKSQLSSKQNNIITNEKQNISIAGRFEQDEKPTPQKSEAPKNNSERNIFLANRKCCLAKISVGAITAT